MIAAQRPPDGTCERCRRKEHCGLILLHPSRHASMGPDDTWCGARWFFAAWLCLACRWIVQDRQLRDRFVQRVLLTDDDGMPRGFVHRAQAAGFVDRLHNLPGIDVLASRLPGLVYDMFKRRRALDARNRRSP